MSDQPMGPGWFQAADGKWYPPPGAQPSPAKKRSLTPWLIVGGLVLFCVLPVGCVGAITLLGAATSTTTTVQAAPRITAPPTSTAVAVGSNDSTTTAAATSTNAPSTTAEATTTTAAAGTSKDNPAPIGTAVTAAKGWSIKVNSAQLNANQALAAENQFNKPDSGKQFMLVNVTLTNNSAKPDIPFVQLKISLATPSGSDIDALGACFASTPNSISLENQLQPGGTVTGNMCFQASSADANSSVLLAEPQFTLDQVADQQFLALK